MFGKMMRALGLASGKADALRDLKKAVKAKQLDKPTVRPIAIRLLESPLALLPAYEVLSSNADDNPRDPAPLFWRAWLLVHSMGLGYDPTDADVLKDTRFLMKRASTLGWDKLDVAELRGELHWITGEPEQARDTWRAVLEERPKPDLYNRLADLELHLCTPNVRTMGEQPTEETFEEGHKTALELFDKALALDPDHAASLVGKAQVLLQLGDAEAAKPLAERARALGYESDTLSQVEVQLERAFGPPPGQEPKETQEPKEPKEPKDGLRIEVLGIVVDGSGFIEKGQRALEPGEFVPGAAEEFCIEFCTRLKIAEGSAVVRHRDAAFFFYVIGDGERCGVNLMDDSEAQEEFQAMFDRQWRELEDQAIV